MPSAFFSSEERQIIQNASIQHDNFPWSVTPSFLQTPKNVLTPTNTKEPLDRKKT